MKSLRLLTLGLLLSATLVAPAIAGNNGMKVYEALPQGGPDSPVLSGEKGAAVIDDQESTTVGDGEPGAIEVQTNVPQAQIDYRDKRVEARMRRDEMLKMRAATIEQERAAEEQPQQ